MQIDIEFMYKLLDKKIKIEKVVDLKVECTNINYYYIGDNNRSIFVSADVIFGIQYIPVEQLEIKHMKIIKRKSSVINLENPIIYDESPIKKVMIDSKGFRLIGKNTIFINASINIILNI